VLKSALALLEAPAGPVLVDFPEEAPLSANLTGWACPLNPSEDTEDKALRAGDRSPLEILKKEIAFLKPWYDLAVRKQGRTTVGLSGLEIAQAAEFLFAFLHDPGTPSPRPGMPVGDALKLASEDLKAYYLEAAAAQPGGATSLHLADWFWGETKAGRMFFDLQKVCMQSSDPMIKMLGTLLLIPRSQAHRVSAG
jgi:hypothetical protein